jgi:hypothetical protein
VRGKIELRKKIYSSEKMNKKALILQLSEEILRMQSKMMNVNVKNRLLL